VADNNSTFMKVGLFGAALYLAYSQGWLSFLGIGTAAAVPATGTPATANPLAVGVPTPTPVSTSPVNVPSTLDSAYAKMVAAATAAGTTSTGVDGWGYYLNNSGAGITSPDPIPAFSAAIPNFDRSQNFTAPQYWAIMAPALRSQLGLSGLGIYGGLGALARRYA
jgi:LDH2 family malate/lactate/ureidoglycolate dehydrogenase